MADTSLYEPAAGACWDASTVPPAPATNSAWAAQRAPAPSVSEALITTCSLGSRPLARIAADSSAITRAGDTSNVCAARPHTKANKPDVSSRLDFIGRL